MTNVLAAADRVANELAINADDPENNARFVADLRTLVNFARVVLEPPVSLWGDGTREMLIELRDWMRSKMPCNSGDCCSELRGWTAKVDQRIAHHPPVADPPPGVNATSAAINWMQRCEKLQDAITARRDETSIEWLNRIAQVRRDLGLTVNGSLEEKQTLDLDLILQQAHDGVFVEHDCPAMYACAAILAEFGEDRVKAYEARIAGETKCSVPKCDPSGG